MNAPIKLYIFLTTLVLCVSACDSETNTPPSENPSDSTTIIDDSTAAAFIHKTAATPSL